MNGHRRYVFGTSRMAKSPPVNIGKTITWLVLGCVVIVILFEVRVDFEFTPGTESEVPDPAVEDEYRRCYEERDDEIHRRAFATIDNPDVQKEFIASNRAIAARDCREQYPERLITVEEPARFGLFDLEPRFW